MKTANKLLSVLLSICLILACASGISAVDGTPNVKMTVSSTSVNVGDTVTVTVSCIEHTVAGFGFYLEFDKELLECTEIIGPNESKPTQYYLLWLDTEWDEENKGRPQVADTVDSTNSDGIYSFGWVPGSDTLILEQTVITLNFTAKAAGTVNFVLNEESSGTDDFKGVAATQSVTINAPVSYPAVNLMGFNGDWGTGLAMTTTDGVTYTYTMELTSGTYEFKIKDDGTWLGNGGTIEDTTTATSATGWEFVDAGNCKLQASGGTYTFSFNAETNMLIITAELDESAHTHTWVDGKCEGCGETKAVYLKGGFNDWGETDPMTWGEGGLYTITKELAGGEYEFKIVADSSWWTNTGTIIDTTNGAAWELYDNSQNIKLQATGGKYTFTYDINNNTLKVDADLPHTHSYENVQFTWNDHYTSCTVTGTCASTVGECTAPNLSTECTISAAKNEDALTITATYGELSDTKEFTLTDSRAVFFDNSKTNWSGNVNVYAWGGSGDSMSWPGVPMTNLGNGLWVIILSGDYDNIIFNNGSDQTNDLTIPNDGRNIAVGQPKENKADAKWGYYECAHDWVDADCENDGYCSICGIAGEASTGHTPGADATCTEDQTCTVCGEVLTEKLGHTAGADATCTEDQTCTVCGEVLAEKNMNAHVASSTISVDNKDGKTHTVKWPCCGTVVNAAEAHSYTNGVCACTAEQSVGITYHANGGNMYVDDDYYGEDVFYTFTYTWGESVEVKADKVNRYEFYVYYAGKQFAGWNTKADGTGTAYAIGDTITLTENITLYAQYKDIAVDGVALNSGEYLDCNGNVTTTKPDGGYAYYANGILTLHNFVGTGGVHATSAATQETGVYYEGYLTMVLEGDNSLSSVYNGIYCYDLTIRGEGSLTITSEYTAIMSDAVTIESGNITLTGEHALSVNDDITITGGTVTGTGYLNSYSGDLILGGVVVRTPAGTTFGSCWSSNYLLGSDGEPVTSFVIGACEHAEKTYTDLENGFHKVTCDTCGETVAESEAHNYTYDSWNHKCECGAVEKFKLTMVYGLNGEYTYEAMVPYGTKFATLDIFKDWQWTIYVNEAGRIGTYDFYDFYVGTSADDLMWDRYFIEGGMYRNIYVDATRYDFTGFVNDGNGWQIMKSGDLLKDEMIIFTMSDLHENGSEEELEGVYMADANGYRIENALGRWYYVGEWPFNGVIYAPNAEDLAYCESKGTTFIDAEKTWYYFGADGKWQYNYTGLVGDSYVVNGQAAWHVGLVQIGEDYYYFKGNASVGGNTMATGNIHASRINGIDGFAQGGIYTFGADGKLCKYNGITEIDGKLYYYVDNRLAIDAGLIRIDGDYYYVRARSGELVVNAEYWVTDVKDFDLVPGLYSFDENGKLINPIDPTVYHGIVDIDGVLYYYQNGVKQSGAGVVDLVDENGKTFYIYVRSNGQLATGVYWPTTLNGKLDSGAYNWGDDGRYYPDAEPVKEIREEGGKYFYYVDGILTKGAGVVDMVDENGEIFYIYVRSNGQLATGIYWPTTRNGLLERGAYDWGTNGRYYPN